MQKLEFEAIGTVWEIIFLNDITKQLESKIKIRIKKFDKNYSRFRNDSLVAEWASKVGEYKLPSDAGQLFVFYKQLYDASKGLVTPLIGRTLEQAGYDAGYSFMPQRLTTPPKWENTIEFKNSKLIVKQPVLLDFGAAGKGYLVDILTHLLYTNHVDEFCINAGGDILARNMPQIIGLEDPDDAVRILGTVEIQNEALCASAGNRRKWNTYHHIINPLTLTPVENVKATWVKAGTTMLADGLATALFFVKPDVLLKSFDFEYAMIDSGNMMFSENFNTQLFTI